MLVVPVSADDGISGVGRRSAGSTLHSTPLHFESACMPLRWQARRAFSSPRCPSSCCERSCWSPSRVA